MEYTHRKPFMSGSDRRVTWRWSRALAAMVALITAGFGGCGSTKSYLATDQLLMSDAVDATVAKLDFSPLAGRKVYLDATYLKTQKGSMLIDSDYVISSLRQQMVGAAVQLVETREECDLIAEARLGALGLDGHNVTYGIPASNAISAASTAITSAPILPVLPEISFARHEAKSGAAKIAVFAYDRQTREPYWQSGIARSASNARDTWVLGVGPWQRGTIYDKAHFAGNIVSNGDILDYGGENIRESQAFEAYRRSRLYDAAKNRQRLEPSPVAGSPPGEPVVTASAEASP